MSKQQPTKPRRRQQIRLVTSVTSSAISLALPALLTAAPNAQLVETPHSPPLAVQRPLLLAYTPANTPQAAVDKYFAEGYTYCDAKVLAAFWGEATPYEAKVRLGDKMLRWGASDAQAHVPVARVQALQKHPEAMPCWYLDGGYSYNDAALVATYWGEANTWDAKLKMTRLLVQGKDAAIQAALRNARSARNAEPQSPPQIQDGEPQPIPLPLASSEQAALEKYFVQGYTYCDAKVLAVFWGEASPYAAKIRLGQKMLSWGPADAQAHVPSAREQALQKSVPELPCDYTDGGYSYDDAALLATYWGENSTVDAKIKMTRLLIQGRNAQIQAAQTAAQAGRDAKG